MLKCRCLKSLRPVSKNLPGRFRCAYTPSAAADAAPHVLQNKGKSMNAKLHRALVAVVVALSVCTVAAGQDKKDSKSSGDLKKLQGVWTTPSQSGEAVVYTFKEDKLTVKAPTRTYKMTVKLDESAKPNKTIDLKIDDGPDDAKGQTSKGIYKFDGDDKFVFCFTPAAERPDKFEQVGFEQFLTELKREKQARK